MRRSASRSSCSARVRSVMSWQVPRMRTSLPVASRWKSLHVCSKCTVPSGRTTRKSDSNGSPRGMRAIQSEQIGCLSSGWMYARKPTSATPTVPGSNPSRPGLENGTLVEYRAILTDHSGNLSVAGTHAVVGDPPPPEDPGGGGPVVQPAEVSVPGSFNSEIGCPGDWMPECDQAQLTLDPDDDIWKGTFSLPAGDWEYKVAIERSWSENYGAGGVRDGANIPLSLPAATEVTFYYDHGTHWVTTDVQDPIVTIPGSFQSELGCPADWDPACMRSWLQDLDGDGIYTFVTTQLPAGSYEAKVTHGLTWDENYGAGGVPDGPNIPFTVPPGSRVTFTYDIASHVLTIATSAAGPVIDLTQARAHWLRTGLFAWDLPDDVRGWRFRLHTAPEGGLQPDAEAVVPGTSLPLALDPAGLPADVAAAFPHLAGYEALRLTGVSSQTVAELLRGQLVVAAYDDLGRLVDATGVQIPGVLDDLYAGAGSRTLGVSWRGATPTLAVWAPTAKDVDLLLRMQGSDTDTTVQLRRDRDGVWSATGRPQWAGTSYLYEVDVYVPSTDAVETNVVTDPYSLALTTNSARSVVVDLGDDSLEPSGWDDLAKPPLAQPEDSTIYELHLRDFSITDETVPVADRGTYRAFTHPDSDGMEHLAELAEAGMNTLHLLPVFDIATIPEVRADQEEPTCDLADLTAADPAGEEQQACLEQVRDTDGFNWGYDPWHYTTPEGSYATDPEGPVRTLEFREMVAAVNDAGLRVVMDVVYNHTTAHGQDPRSVLDRIVPGYYHRLSATGDVEMSTCCSNTASKHAMMEKLIVDSVLTWATEYKVDGFRFDLLGHHSRATMERVRSALDELTLTGDDVDGESIYVYGEGWNFGEVADNARFRQATQLELFGAGIGTFSDRLRDAVRGGGPFDEDPGIQGFASGLYSEPNDSPANGTAEEQLARLLLYHDQIKVGLAGNLRDYTFVDRTGATVTGADVPYGASPAGYAADPSEVITYVDAHDNETVFDALTFKLAAPTTMADRVRMNAPGAVDHRPGTDAVVLARRSRHPAVEVAGPELVQLG